MRRFLTAFQHLSDREFEPAINLFQRVLAEDPNHVQSYGNMGLAYAGLGKKVLALACLDQALKLDPSYEPAQINRRVVAEMTEGEPHIAGELLQVEYFRDKFRRR